jgi:hypothetical protein
MGAGQSNTTNIVSTAVNRTATNIAKKTTTKIGTTNINANSFRLELAPIIVRSRSSKFPDIVIPPSMRGAKINLSQKIVSSKSSALNAALKDEVALKEQMTAALQAAASQANATQQGALSTSLGVNVNNANINTYIANIVNTNITSDTMAQLDDLLTNANEGVLLLTGNNDGLELTAPQEILAQQAANIISTAIMSTEKETVLSGESKTESKQDNTIKQQGAISALTGLVGMTGLTIMLPLIICVAVIAIFLGPSLLKGKGGMMKKPFFGFKRFRFGRRR